MKLFAFEWSDYRCAFGRDGWVHVKDGIDPELLDVAREYSAGKVRSECRAATSMLLEKVRYVFDPPWDMDYEHGLFDFVAPLTGLSRDHMTLSARHMTICGSEAIPSPPPHKDRYSSQIVVGLSIVVPPGSHLVLYPDEERKANLSSEQELLLEMDLPDSYGVEIYDAPGDVIVFPGSSMWHARRRSAGAAHLYFMLNDFDSDPLGEDPFTAARRSTTLTALSTSSEEFKAMVPVLSRRFDSVVREWSRARRGTSRSAIVWGLPPIELSYAEDSVLRSLGGGRSLEAITVARADIGEEVVEKALRRLARRGVIDLLPAAAAT